MALLWSVACVRRACTRARRAFVGAVRGTRPHLTCSSRLARLRRSATTRPSTRRSRSAVGGSTRFGTGGAQPPREATRRPTPRRPAAALGAAPTLPCGAERTSPGHRRSGGFELYLTARTRGPARVRARHARGAQPHPADRWRRRGEASGGEPQAEPAQGVHVRQARPPRGAVLQDGARGSRRLRRPRDARRTGGEWRWACLEPLRALRLVRLEHQCVAPLGRRASILQRAGRIFAHRGQRRQARCVLGRSLRGAEVVAVPR